MQSYNYSTDKQKEKFLIRIGQYDKVYAPDDESENHTDYPYIDTTNNKRFKTVAYEKVYAPDNESENYTDYPYVDTSNNKRFKKVAYEKVCTPVKQNNIKQENQSKDKNIIKEESSYNKNDNKIANAIGFIGIMIFIVGFIIGIIMGVQLANFFTTIIFWCITAIIGISFLGFAEIINLLDALVHKK